MLEDPIVLAILSKLQTFELINEHVDAASIRNEKVIGLTRLLRGRIELLEQVLRCPLHYLVMRGFFRCLAKLIPVVDVAVARSNDQV